MPFAVAFAPKLEKDSSKKARDAETPDPLAIGVVSFRMGATVRVPRLMTVSLPSPAEIPSAVAWDAAFPKESPARLRLPFSALALEVALTVTDSLVDDRVVARAGFDADGTGLRRAAREGPVDADRGRHAGGGRRCARGDGQAPR